MNIMYLGNTDGGSENKQHCANRPEPCSDKVQPRLILTIGWHFIFRDISVGEVILPKNTIVNALFVEILKVTIV